MDESGKVQTHKDHKRAENETKSFLSYHKNPEWPPVSTLCVSSPVYDLGSHVLDGPTEGIGSFIVVNGLLTQTEVWQKTEREVKKKKLCIGEQKRINML